MSLALPIKEHSQKESTPNTLHSPFRTTSSTHAPPVVVTASTPTHARPAFQDSFSIKITFASSADQVAMSVQSTVPQLACCAPMDSSWNPKANHVFNVIPIASPALQLPKSAPLVKPASTFLKISATPVLITAYHVAKQLHPLIPYATFASQAMLIIRQPKHALNASPDVPFATPIKFMNASDVGKDSKLQKSTMSLPVKNAPITAEFVKTVYVKFAEMVSD